MCNGTLRLLGYCCAAAGWLRLWALRLLALAWLLGMAQIFFIVNIIYTLFKERTGEINPWNATTIDWTETTSPPLGHGNFEKIPVVYRGPYEYSVPGAKIDFMPQTEKG